MKPSPYLTLHYLPRPSQILLHTAHWRTDGVGIQKLLDAYYILLVSSKPGDLDHVTWGEEVPRLAPAIEDLLKIPTDTDSSMAQEAQRCFETFFSAAESVGVKLRPNSEPVPGSTRSSRMELSKSTTNAVVTACKRNGISVTAAVHAAVAEANYAFAQNEDKKKHYSSTVRFSFRPHLPAPYNGVAGAAGLYTTGTMIHTPADVCWAANAAHYHTVYQAGLSLLYINSHRAYANHLIQMLKTLPPDAPTPSNVDLSSFGVIENIVSQNYGTAKRGLETKTVSIGTELLTQGMVVFFWTFRGQLTFNLAWNESFHSSEGGDAFLNGLRESLGRGLDIAI